MADEINLSVNKNSIKSFIVAIIILIVAFSSLAYHLGTLIGSREQAIYYQDYMNKSCTCFDYYQSLDGGKGSGNLQYGNLE